MAKTKTTKKPVTKKTVSKVASKKRAVVKKPVNKKSSEKVDSKKAKVVKKPITKKTKAPKSNKDVLLIILLSVIVIGIIVSVIFVTPKYVDNSDLSDTNNLIDENSLDINITPVLDPKEQRLAEIQEEAQELSLAMFNEIKDSQLDIFETWYEELNLNKEEIDSCLEQNNYLNQKLDFEQADILNKISQDFYLAQSTGILGTPGTFVNSFFISGHLDFDEFSEVYEIAVSEEIPDINFESESNFVFDANKSPTLNVIYNENYTKTDQTIELLKDNPENTFFPELFAELELNKIDYKTEEAQEILKKAGAPFLPLFYIEGNIEALNISKKADFNSLFFELEEGFFVLNPQVTGISQNLLYESFLVEEDYIIGDSNSTNTIMIFIDYSCNYSKMFETETLPQIITNYVDTNKAKVIIKDLPINQEISIFPAIFARCAQEQGKFLETHLKLFENNSAYTTSLVETISNKYTPQLTALENEFNSLIEE